MKEDHTSATSSSATTKEKGNENTTSGNKNNDIITTINEETKFESTNITIIQSFLDTISSSSSSTMTGPVPKGYTIDQIDTSSIKVLEELLLEQLNHNSNNNIASSSNNTGTGIGTNTGKTVHFSYSTPTNSYTNTMMPNAPEKPSVSLGAISTPSPSTINKNSTGTMKSNSSTNTSTGTTCSSNSDNTTIDMMNEYHDENVYNQMTDTERMMYHQIQYQMKMIQQIQKQLNHITTTMMMMDQQQHHQQQQQGGVTYPSTKTSTNRNVIPTRQVGVTIQPPQERQPQQQQQPNNMHNENHNSIFHSIQTIRQRIITKVQNQFLFITKMIHIFKLYRNLLIKYRTNTTTTTTIA